MRSKSLFHTSLLGLNHQTMKYTTKRHLALASILWLALVGAFIPLTSGNALKKFSKSILCADEKCQSLYGKGHTITRYPSPEQGILSFKKDSPVKIFGRTEDNQHLYVEINNSRGFVPTKHIQEDSIHNPDLLFKVDLPSDVNQNQPNSSVDPPADSAASETPVLSNTPSSQINEQPDPQFVYASKSAIVIEGTTFYEDILKTNTPSPTYPADAVTKTATIEAHFAGIELDKQSASTPATVGGGENISSGDNAEKDKIMDLLKTSLQVNNADALPKAPISSENDTLEPVSLTSDTQRNVSQENEEKVAVIESNQTENSDTVKEKEGDATQDENVHEESFVKVQNASESETSSTLDNSSQPDHTHEATNGETATHSEPSDVNDPVVAEEETNENSLLSESESKVESANLSEPIAKSAETSATNKDPESTEEEEDALQVETVNEQNVSESNVSDTLPVDTAQLKDDSSSPLVESPNSSEPMQTDEAASAAPPAPEPAEVSDLPQSDAHVDVPLSRAQVLPQVIANETVASESQQRDSELKEEFPNVVNSHLDENSLPPPAPADPLNEMPNSVHLPQESVNSLPDPSLVNNPSVLNPTSETEPQLINPNPNLHPPSEQNFPLHTSEPIQLQESRQPYVNELPNVPSRFPRRFGLNSNPNIQPRATVDSNVDILANAPNPHVYPSPPSLPLSPQASHSFAYVSAEIPSPSVDPVPPQPSHFNTPPDVPNMNPPDSNVPQSSEPALGNFNVEAKIIPPKVGDWNQPQQQSPQQHETVKSVTADADLQHHSNFVNPSVTPPNSAPSYPASDALVDADKYSGPAAENLSNGSRRRLLAEKVAFVGVIMEIIPDEVELFFENANISMHVIIFTSIIAFFWCFAKVVVSFINSSKKERDLRDINCQVQRKIYYFEAEKDKLREEAKEAKDRLNNFQLESGSCNAKNLSLHHEIDVFKIERSKLQNELSHWKAKAEKAPKTEEIATARANLESINSEKRQLEAQIEELEDKIDSDKLAIGTLENTVKSLNDKIKELNENTKELKHENEELSEQLNVENQDLAIFKSENQELKAKQNQLTEELRNLKDELLSSQEHSLQLEEVKATQTEDLLETKARISLLEQQVEAKNTELTSMQTLLSKLNKNISNKERRRLSQLSTDLNGDITDAVNGENALPVGPASPTLESVALTKSADDEGENDMQDIVQLQLRLTNTELAKAQLEAKIASLHLQLDSTKGELESLKSVNISLKEETDNASKERLKAVTELEVLSKYYKEKELEYGKEIGVQRVKREQKEEDATSMAARLDSFQEENETLKKHMKSVKKELEETERRYKSQMNSLEKQSHENWIAARNAERKYEESKAEASALRQTLTLSVKSPPPSDLSLSGFVLDDSASSISSLPDGFNTSLQQLPVPPPPPPPLMMPSFNSLIPGMVPINPAPGQPPMYGDLNDSSNFWNSSGPSSFGHLPVSNSANNSMTGVSLANNSADSSMVFVQSSQLAYAPPPVSNQQASSQNHQVPSQYSAFSGPPQQHHPYQQWEDLSRNAYSPALSQRSATATPLTGHPMAATSTPAVSQAYMPQHPQPAPSGQYQQPPQAQQQQHYASDTSATAGSGTNPYSIASYPNHYNQQTYQQQQVPADSNGVAAYGTSGTTASGPLGHQIWTAGQAQMNNDTSNVYGNYPAAHGNNSYGGSLPQVDESNSRPASVHTQMV